jgi:putative zinc finger protein
VIPYLGCDAAREMLEAFVDGELPTTEQVALESHLRWCAICRARVEDMQLIGASLRLGSRAQETDASDLLELAAIQSDVLTRVRAEHDQSFPVFVHEIFEDMRFLWPAIGATAALMVCVFAAVSVHTAARGADPDSMANMIKTLASESAERIAPRPFLSSYYPVQLDGRILAPRSLDDGSALESIPQGDAVFALEAVVTREGRVVDSELLHSQRSGVMRRAKATEDDEVTALLDAVNRSRFTPAQAADGGGAVAVRVVWILARTTVKGSPRADATPPVSDVLVRPAPRPARS